MGSPPAPMYATLYFFIHEEKIIPKYEQLTFYQRYINNSFGLWTTAPSNDCQIEFQQDFNSFGKLNWDFSPPQKHINFLDVDIEIDNNNLLKTSIFEKILNKYRLIRPNRPYGQFKVFNFFDYHKIILMSVRFYTNKLNKKKKKIG